MEVPFTTWEEWRLHIWGWEGNKSSAVDMLSWRCPCDSISLPSLNFSNRIPLRAPHPRKCFWLGCHLHGLTSPSTGQGMTHAGQSERSPPGHGVWP